MSIDLPEEWASIKIEAKFDNSGYELPDLEFINDAQELIYNHVNSDYIIEFPHDPMDWYHFARNYVKNTGMKFRLPRKLKKKIRDLSISEIEWFNITIPY